MIDIERFLQTLIIDDGQLAIVRKGVGVVENILMARTLMYSSVYFHKTVRIAELMLSKSIEMIPDVKPFDFFKMTDAELINDLKNKGPYQNEIITFLKYRILFKQAYILAHSNLDEQKKEIVKDFENVNIRKEKEQEIEDALNIPYGHVIIDVPYMELHQSEPRIDKTDITIIDNNEKKSMDEFTPVARAVRSRMIPDWLVMIVTDEKYREVLSKKSDVASAISVTASSVRSKSSFAIKYFACKTASYNSFLMPLNAISYSNVQFKATKPTTFCC